MKRALAIVGAIVILIGIGVGIYFFFFAGKGGGLTAGGPTQFPGSGTTAGGTGTAAQTQELGVPVSGAGTEVAPHLIRISDRPVAVGAVAVYEPGILATSSKKASATSTPAYLRDPDVRIEYIERESGNVYGFEAHVRTLTRLSNKTLPGVQEASWLPDGSQVYARFLEKSGTTEHIDTYALPTTSSGGYFLEKDLSQVLVSGSSTLVTLLPSTTGSIATLSNPSGTSVRTLFASALAALRVTLGGATYIATTKASATTDGYAFLVDPKSGAFTRVLGPIQGLTTLVSPSGKFLLYSYLDHGKLSLAVLDLTLHTALQLPLATLPEKCAWASDSLSVFCAVPTTLTGTYPDDWYQGVTESSDRFWRIDLTGRVATQLIDPKTAGNVDIDAVGLSVDRTNDVLIFTNRKDKTFWMYDL